MLLLITLLPLAGGPPALPPAGEAAGSSTAVAAAAAPRVEYEEVLADAERHTGQRLGTALQFHSLFQKWNPYLTRFTPEAYLGIQAWTDAQLPWIREAYDAPAVQLYVRRDSELAGLFTSARRHDRFEVTFIVREHFAGRSWGEILEARRTPDSVPEGTVLHAVRALDWMEKGVFDLAGSELDRALSAPLPDHAWEALLELRRRCVGDHRDQRERPRRRTHDTPLDRR